MAKPKVNYWVDVMIGAAFVVSAVSGLVFLLPISPGSTRILGLTYGLWDALHLWGSLAMIAGVLTHLVLHSKWIVAMTQKTFGLSKRQPAHGRAASPVPAPGSVVNRRRFLTLGATTLVVGAILAGGSAALGAVARALESVVDDDAEEGGALKAASAKDGAEAEAGAGGEAEEPEVSPEPEEPTASDDLAPSDAVGLDDTTPTPEVTTGVETTVDPTATPAPAAKMCVTCPRGLVNDPYPGRCRLYVDRDNDRICDRSVPAPCG